MNKQQKHKELLNKLEELYKTKNADYGDSVSETYKKYGMTSFLVRIEDKLNRVRTLSQKDAKVQDEKIEDTLLDLANYAILAIIEKENGSKGGIENMYLICNVGCDDTTYTELDLSQYEYRVLEKIAIENNKNSRYGCQPKIEIYSEYQKENGYFNYKWEDNLVPIEEE